MVLLVSALPVVELRGAIPLAISKGISPAEAYFLAVLGNLLPVPFLLLFLGEAEKRLRRFPLFDSFFEWLFLRTRRKTNEKIRKYGALGLIPFVAIPFPVTGAWTGALASYIFGIELRYALPCIAIGVSIAGVIVTLSCLGVTFIF